MKTKSLTLAIMITVIFTFIGCKKDSCKDVTCQNGGTCVNGKCNCPYSFSGDFCEVKETLSGQLRFSVRLSNVSKNLPETYQIKVKGSSNSEFSDCIWFQTSSYTCCNDLVSGDVWTPSMYCSGDYCDINWTAPCTFEKEFVAGQKGIPNGDFKPGVYTIELIFRTGNGSTVLLDTTVNVIGGQAIRVEENETTQLATIDIVMP